MPEKDSKQELAAETAEQLQKFQNCQDLASLVNTRGWEVIVGLLQNYASDATEQLLNIPPGDEHVPCAHAAASATQQILSKFLTDARRMVEIAHDPSQILS